MFFINGILRWVYGIAAVLIGLPLLLSSAFQSSTSIGYPSRPDDEISANFLSGSEDFIDEAVSDKWSVGYAKNELTPDDVDNNGFFNRYFLGGYLRFPAQEATGILDELWVRAIVLDDNSGRGAIAFAWIDTVGLMNPDVKLIREKLADIIGKDGLISINVGSTHTHTAVDTQGLWGNIPSTGMNKEYMNALVEKTADVIRTAYNTRSEGTLYYGTKDCSSFFTDGRAPRSFDKNIHLLRFVPDDASKREIYLSNFGAHPVNVPWSETRLSADFPYQIEKSVNETCGADFIYIQGAIGGAIHGNMGVNGISKDLSKYERLTEYAKEVTKVLKELAETAEEVKPVLNVAHSQVDLELENFVFKLAERSGIVSAKAYMEDGKVMLTTEIGYAEIGDNIKILMMPGEIFPEIVYGNFLSAENSFNGTEYPCAALNTQFSKTDKVLTFGLCNDAIGYIVPDNDYDSSKSHETISVGPKAASTLSKAFEDMLAGCR